MTIEIPAELKPADGRFGSGPSKVPATVVRALADTGGTVLGTSHRQAPVKQLVARIRAGLSELFALPDGWAVVLGNGGSTAFWDVAAFGLIRDRAQHLVCGEFSAKFAALTASAPFLGEPVRAAQRVRQRAERRTRTGRGRLRLAAERDLHRRRAAGGRECRRPSALMLVDATSAAGAIELDITQSDVYYFAPQKVFAAEAGLWVSLLSPAALARAAEVRDGRWAPPSLDLTIAIDNSAKDQTYNTPSVASLWLLAHQVDWLLASGGLPWAAGRTADSSGRLYAWADKSEYAVPFVSDPSLRSPVVGTIDFADAVDAVGCRRDPARERNRRHRAVPRARPQPTAHRHVPRRRARTTCPR